MHHNSEQEKIQRRVAKLMGSRILPKEYAERRDDFSDPHIEIVEAGDVSIACFGANHQNNPEDEQMRQIQEMMDAQRPDVVMVEGMPILEEDSERREKFLEKMRAQTYEEAVRNGESYMTAWYAAQNGITVISPEPSYQDLFSRLQKEDFDPRAIWLKNVLAMGAQWANFNPELAKDVEKRKKAVSDYCRRFQEMCSRELDLPVYDDVLAQVEEYAKALGMPLNQDNMFEDDVVMNLVDPIPWEGKTMHPTNNVAQASSRYRDECIIERMLREIEAGNKRQMIVYGYSHIHILSPVIRDLVERYAI